MQELESALNKGTMREKKENLSMYVSQFLQNKEKWTHLKEDIDKLKSERMARIEEKISSDRIQKSKNILNRILNKGSRQWSRDLNRNYQLKHID